jgi:hypothetical protein
MLIEGIEDNDANEEEWEGEKESEEEKD